MKADYASKFVATGGYRTHYLEAGTGDPLLLVHGAAPGANAEYSWKTVIPILAQRFHTYAMDLLGFGESDKPVEVDYTYQRFVEQIEEFLEALSLGKGVRLVGNSVGAYVAIRFALDHPEKTKKVAAIASTVLAAALGVQYKPGEAVKALVEYDGTPERMRRLLNYLVYNKTLVTEEGVRSRNAVATAAGAREAMNSLNAYMKLSRENELYRQSFDLRNRLPGFKIPLLLIWGEKDEFAPVEIGRAVSGVLPNAEFVTVADAGHQCMIDEPEAVGRLLVEFMSR